MNPSFRIRSLTRLLALFLAATALGACCFCDPCGWHHGCQPHRHCR